MKGLSLRQPWAELILRGTKTIETRKWRTSYRGPIALHASLTYDEARRPSFHGVTEGDCAFGKIVGVATLVDVRLMTPEDEAGALFPCEPGRFAFVLADVRRVDPIAYRGALNLFKLDGETLRALDVERAA